MYIYDLAKDGGATYKLSMEGKGNQLSIKAWENTSFKQSWHTVYLRIVWN